VLLMPLIGAVDQDRARQALDSLLQHIQAERARFVIIDVTGLAVIDTAVAATLLQCARAARLLGAQTTLVGVRPEVAQTMVTLGTDLEDLHFMSTLEAAIALVFTRPGRQSRR
jgi:rsbT co-antagonist protein RsbR